MKKKNILSCILVLFSSNIFADYGANVSLGGGIEWFTHDKISEVEIGDDTYTKDNKDDTYFFNARVLAFYKMPGASSGADSVEYKFAFGFDYVHNYSERVTGSTMFAFSDDGTYQYDLVTNSQMALLTGGVSVNSFDIYLLLGLGSAENKAQGYIEIPEQGAVYQGGQTRSYFAYKFGVGLTYYIYKRFGLGVEYFYADYGKSEVLTSSDPNIALIDNIRSHNILIGLYIDIL